MAQERKDPELALRWAAATPSGKEYTVRLFLALEKIERLVSSLLVIPI
jgi:hypothetical protein